MSKLKVQKTSKAQTGKRTAFGPLAEKKKFWHLSFDLHLSFACLPDRQGF
jgi:hypothetical protein